MLTAEGHNFMLSQPCPKFSALDAARSIGQTTIWSLAKVQWDNKSVTCILMSLSNALQHEMHDFSLALDIMASLKEKFGEKRQDTAGNPDWY